MAKSSTIANRIMSLGALLGLNPFGDPARFTPDETDSFLPPTVKRRDFEGEKRRADEARAKAQTRRQRKAEKRVAAAQKQEERKQLRVGTRVMLWTPSPLSYRVSKSSFDGEFFYTFENDEGHVVSGRRAIVREVLS